MGTSPENLVGEEAEETIPMNAACVRGETLFSKEKIYRDIVGIIQELSEDWDEDESVEERTLLVEDLGFESIDIVVLGTMIEKFYGRQFPFAAFLAEIGEREVKDLAVGELVAFVHGHLQNEGGS